MIGTDVCACGCGEAIVQMQTGRVRLYLNRTHRQRADYARVKAERSAPMPAPLPAPVVEHSGPAPKLCGLCPMQSRRGNYPCTHTRLAARWINEPASEARIHGACPWGRPEAKP
jgi:hypothetical protein